MDKGEHGTYVCGRCKQSGHNSRTCQNPPVNAPRSSNPSNQVVHVQFVYVQKWIKENMGPMSIVDVNNRGITLEHVKTRQLTLQEVAIQAVLSGSCGLCSFGTYCKAATRSSTFSSYTYRNG
ncbi:uncharacterized protein [Aristolochia californica]|uniref:uncharacterized protein isoform X1 n=1 Tax=Aristolochia californica TaxID=171875 RepID=UPI0035DD6B5C